MTTTTSEQTLRDVLNQALALLTEYHIKLVEQVPDARIIEPLIRDLSAVRKAAIEAL
jgi:hypothetical protein